MNGRFPFKLDSFVSPENGKPAQLVIDIAKPEETEELHLFLLTYFSSTDPLHKILQVDEPGATEEILKLRRERPWYSDIIRSSNNLSLTVRDEAAGGRLVALVVNTLEEKSPKITSSLYVIENDEKMKKANKVHDAMMEVLEEGLDLFSTYQTERILCLYLLCVHPAYSRRGLGRKLIELSIEMAKDHGTGAIQTTAFNEYTFKAASILGFDTLAELDFATFDLDGVRPYENELVLITENPKVRYMAHKI